MSNMGMSSVKKFGSAHDLTNTNVRRGGAVGRHGLTARKPGSNRGPAEIAGGGGQDVTACGFVDHISLGYT